MNLTRQRWQADFDAVAKAVPAGWFIEDDDGKWFLPQYEDEKLTRAHLSLSQVGYARGWL